MRIILVLPLAALILSGCVSVKTEHKIEPIQITVDINVKSDRELDSIFGDLYSDPTAND